MTREGGSGWLVGFGPVGTTRTGVDALRTWTGSVAPLLPTGDRGRPDNETADQRRDRTEGPLDGKPMRPTQTLNRSRMGESPTCTRPCSTQVRQTSLPSILPRHSPQPKLPQWEQVPAAGAIGWLAQNVPGTGGPG